MQSIKVDSEWIEFGIEYLDKRCTAESRAAVGVERGSLGAHSCQARPSWLQQLLVESLTGLRSHMLEMRVCGLVTRY